MNNKKGEDGSSAYRTPGKGEVEKGGVAFPIQKKRRANAWGKSGGKRGKRAMTRRK